MNEHIEAVQRMQEYIAAHLDVLLVFISRENK